MVETTTKPVFLYDDGCPLCRGYTKTFTTLGWAERAPFSKIGEDTMAALDMDKARHHIPLTDAMGETRYGLDGILDVVGDAVPILGKIGRAAPVRAVLNRLYWFITYNRRHIVAAAPPAEGVDCAPDFKPEPVAAYLTFCGVAAAGLATTAGAVVPVVGATAAGAVMVAGRDEGWKVENMEAAAHVGTVALAAAGAAGAANLLGANRALVTAAAIATAGHKLWLRRWMRDPGTRLNR